MVRVADPADPETVYTPLLALMVKITVSALSARLSLRGVTVKVAVADPAAMVTVAEAVVAIPVRVKSSRMVVPVRARLTVKELVVAPVRVRSGLSRWLS